MRSHGYWTSYANKRGGVKEGCAIFLSESKFVVLDSLSVPLKYLLRNDSRLEFVFKSNPHLFETVCEKLGMVCQLVVAETRSEPPNIFLIANTHLYYHPDADFIRFIQTYAVISVVEKMKELIHAGDYDFRTFLSTIIEDNETVLMEDAQESSWRKEKGALSYHTIKRDVIVCLCGDFNSTPETAAIEYLVKGVVAFDHEIWSSIGYYIKSQQAEVETEDDGIHHTTISMEESPSLSHNLRLMNLSGCPKYTNFTAGFQDCLDYVFISRDAVNVHSVAPLPSYDDLTENIALPSMQFPSDHVSIVVDVSLGRSEEKVA